MPARMTRARMTARTMVAVLAPPPSLGFAAMWWSTSMSLLMLIPLRLLEDCEGFISRQANDLTWQYQLPHPLSGTSHLPWMPSGKGEMKSRPLQKLRCPCNILWRCEIIWRVYFDLNYLRGWELRIRNQTVLFIPLRESMENSVAASYTSTFSLPSPSTFVKVQRNTVVKSKQLKIKKE